jgi:hypothetical protein
LLLSAGTAYGLIFGLSFALFTWGYDALLLASSAADLAWAKLLLGLLLAITIGGLAGRLVALPPSTATSIALWATVGALLGMIAGRIPFDGGNLAAWLVDRRLWGLVVFPYGSSAATRTALVVVIGAGLGAAAGLAERLAVEWAWDRVTPKGRMGGRSWAVLLVCLPLTLIAAWAADDLINQPLRAHQQAVGELITLALAGASEEAEARGLNYVSVARHRERLSEQYTVYLVDYDLDTYDLGRVDVAFDNGFTLRCMTARSQVGYCSAISDVYQGWMDDLIYTGLYGERRWLSSLPPLTVDDTVVMWLDARSDQLSEIYEVAKVGQRGRWVFMSARFDTGSDIVCRFRGVAPVVVDQCVEASTAPHHP